MELSYDKGSFDDLAGICVNMAKNSLLCDTFFNSDSELRWYLAHMLKYDNLGYDVKCENNQVIVSDRDGYIVLDGAGDGPQPYLIDADGQRVGIKGDYEKPGVWSAVKRSFRRLKRGEYYLPYPITRDDLLSTVERTMKEHGPGWRSSSAA